MSRTTTLIAISIMAAGALASGCKKGDPRGRLGETIACTPGASIEVACGSECGLGTCSGDPQLHVCEGAVSVDACAGDRTLALGFNDDRCGLCPGVTVVCPPTGVLTVAPLPYRTSEYRCVWEARETTSSTGEVLLDAGL